MATSLITFGLQFTKLFQIEEFDTQSRVVRATELSVPMIVLGLKFFVDHVTAPLRFEWSKGGIPGHSEFIGTSAGWIDAVLGIAALLVADVVAGQRLFESRSRRNAL